MTNTSPKYWFPAKQYGWGWGLPFVWQGWAVLTAFALLLAVSAIVFPPKLNGVSFFLCSTVWTAALVGIC